MLPPIVPSKVFETSTDTDTPTIKLADAITFVRYASLTKPYLEQLAALSLLDGAPNLLPGPITKTLCGIMGWDECLVADAWDSLKEDIWGMPPIEVTEAELMRYNQFALPEGTSFRHLFPGFARCKVESCNKKLTDPKSFKATLYTVRHGALPIFTTSLYCRSCNIRYHHNYGISAKLSLRTYYGGIPDVIQVSMHYFMEATLLELISVGKVFGWLSAANWARIYDNGLGKTHAHVRNNPHAFAFAPRETHEHPTDWQSGLSLRPEDVLNGFFLYALLLHKAENNFTLQLPHQAASQEKRIQEALSERNQGMEGIGQELYPHACDVCFHTMENSAGQLVKLQAAVCDGITLGHPCCAQHDCKEALQSHADRFCASHQEYELLCAVRGCQVKRQPGFRTCADKSHRRSETRYFEKGTAMFQLAARLKKAGITVPTDSIPTTQLSGPASLLYPQDDDNEAEDPANCNGKSDTRAKLKGSFAHNFTNTELVFMRPCGIILSRITLFGSEAISAVHLAAKATFPTPESTPEYLFYDSNCRLIAHQRSIGDTHFARTGQPVDVFHFKCKHKETDLDCQRHCNPASFPELMVNGKWRFNSSICEQTNVWLGGYRAILRNMETTRYNFYLDEMIKRHNRFVARELERKNTKVWVVPMSSLVPSSSPLACRT